MDKMTIHNIREGDKIHVACSECGTILSLKEIKTGFCTACDPAIDSPLDKDLSRQDALKQVRGQFSQEDEQ